MRRYCVTHKCLLTQTVIVNGLELCAQFHIIHRQWAKTTTVCVIYLVSAQAPNSQNGWHWFRLNNAYATPQLCQHSRNLL